MRLLRDIFITIALVACFAAVVEFGMKTLGVNYAASLYYPDRDVGYALRPNAAGWSIDEREVFIRVNSQGLRDREHSLARPEGVIRIAVLGDSYAEARQVDEQFAFWSVLERDMNQSLEKLGMRVEVINFGVAGYGLPQEYELLEKQVWQYDPQIVVLTGNLHSFILRCNRNFGTHASEGAVPYFVKHDGALALDDITLEQRRDFVPQSARETELADLTNASRLLSLLNAARRRWAEELTTLQHRLHGIKDVSTGQTADLEDLVLRGPAMGADFDQAWGISQDLIRRSQQLATQHHAEFWLFLTDMPPQIDPNPQRRLSKQRELGIDDLFGADRLIDDFARREGIRHAWLSPKMLAFAEQNNVALHGFDANQSNIGHWNEKGHEVAGELIAQRLLNCSEVIRGKGELVHNATPSICNDVIPEPDGGHNP